MSSHMQRTKKELKKLGIKHQVVERYHPRSKKYPFGCKEDLFNIIDLIALDGGVVGIQVCGADWTPHIRKITQDEAESTRAWLGDGRARLEVWGWRKLKKKRGGKQMVWKPRVADVLMVNNEIYVEERSAS